VDILFRLLAADLPRLAAGLAVTAEICVLAYAAALIGGLALCLLRLYVRALRPLLGLLLAYMRNTPIFVQLLWVAYAWYDALGWPRAVFTAAWVALALQSCGYLAETFRAGIAAVPRGHTEAALAIGMTRAQAMRRIVLPQVLVTMAPSLMNQFIVVVKCSTLVSVIAVPDLMGEALRLTTEWNEPVGILSFTAAIYIALLLAIGALADRAAARLRVRYG
jgi:polar amino acid transport system permease protein